ncbi:MAG: DUF3500 domain-containing protein [Spirosomaceae bacterium]|nr:DUF3500 domain-containing protein [Spirosomataceae bacterium]
MNIDKLLLVFSCKEEEVTSSTSASVSALSCSSASFSATPSANAAFAGTATVQYTGGNGAAYAAGSSVASAITGTPSASGTATFAISVGGQSCTLSLSVNAASTGGGTTSTAGWNVDTDMANIVAMANAFKASLSSSQATSLQYDYTLAQAKLWSNLPQSLYRNRVGLASSTFSTAQWTAFYNLLKASTGTGANEGNEEYTGIIDADDYLLANGGGSGYGKGNYYIAFLGTPSATGLWCLQIGGHHGTNIFTYNNGKMTGGTPSFRSTEPYPTWTSTNTGKLVQPLVQETAALSNFLKSLSAAELTTAKRAAAQNDIIVGPQKDGTFPTTKTGIKASSLTQAKKDLLLAAIKTYVDDLDDKAAAAVLAKYKAELDDTYVSYVGGTTMAEKGDYILIDGPSVWIEWSMQSGIVIRTGVHPHSVWRDRKADYGGN